MKVLVDHQIFLNQTAGGVSRYHATINNYVNAFHSDIQSRIIALGHQNIYIPEQAGALKFLNIKGAHRILKFINRQYVLSQLDKFDILHPSFYEGYFLTHRKRPKLIVTIHDMIPEIYFKQRTQWMIDQKRDMLKYADAIIAISNNTKKELLRFYQIDEKKIHVIHHGYPENFNAPNQPNPTDPDFPKQIPSRYILYVGTRIDYKNFIPWLKAISTYLKTNNLNVVAAGDPPSESEKSFIAQLELTDRIHFTGRISDTLLSTLYKNALCFSFPSSIEGFGMPILEAFVSNCPVLCSNIDVFHEICGNAAVYFDPMDAESVAKAHDKVLSSEENRNALILQGGLKLKDFTWEDSARKTMAVYSSLN